MLAGKSAHRSSFFEFLPVTDFEEQQAELIPEPQGFELPEWCGWFLPVVFLVCFGVGAVVITKWVIEALLWVVRHG